MAHKDTLAYRSGKFVRRNKAGVMAATLVLVSLLVGLGTTLWQAHRAEQEASSKRRQLYVAQMGKAYQAWENANGELVQELLEAHRPKSGEEDLRGFEWHYLWRLAHSDLRTIQLADSPLGSLNSLIALSRDGKTLALGNTNGNLKFCDLMTGEPRALFKAPVPSLFPVALSPDSKTVALSDPRGERRTIELWDVLTRRKWATLRAHGTGVRSAVFSPDGQTLAAGDMSNIVTLWDVTTRQERAILKDPGKLVFKLVFSPDSNLLATGGEDYTITLWDVAAQKVRTTLKAHKKVIRAMAFSPDGKMLASSCNDTLGSLDAYTQLWDITTQREQAALREKTTVDAIAFSPDGKILALGNNDHTVKLWDTATRQEMTTLMGHSESIRWVAFFPDGQTLASVDDGGLVKLWNVTTRQGPRTLTGHTDQIARVAFSPDGQTLASGSMDARVRLWDVATGQTRASLSKHKAALHSLAFAPDGKTLVTGSLDGTLMLWDLENQPQELVTLSRGVGVRSIRCGFPRTVS